MKTKSYKVRWEIDIDAKSHRQAAQGALEIQRDPDSIALFFYVADHMDICMGMDITDWKEIDLSLEKTR